MKIQFSVHGEAKAKGSATSFYSAKQGRTFSHQATSTVEWGRQVKYQAQEAVKDMPTLMEGPLVVSIDFLLPKPASAPKKKEIFPVKRPDLDKLIRAVLDGMTGILYRDDSQVVSIFARKTYDPKPRADIKVATLDGREVE